MNRLFSIPKDALAELLKAAGSDLTPEEYAASLANVDAFRRYPSRARASAWSRNVIVLAAVVSVLWLAFGFDVEDFLIAVGLVIVSFFEFRVHRYFSENNPAAPDLGFRNQSAFAAALLIYGLYHAFVAYQIQVPNEYREYMDAGTTSLVQGAERVIYLVIGAVGGVSQFALAWYYRAARLKP